MSLHDSLFHQKGASDFHLMATVVLVGLIYMICEMYIDVAVFLVILISNLFQDTNI